MTSDRILPSSPKHSLSNLSSSTFNAFTYFYVILLYVRKNAALYAVAEKQHKETYQEITKQLAGPAWYQHDWFLDAVYALYEKHVKDPVHGKFNKKHLQTAEDDAREILSAHIQSLHNPKGASISNDEGDDEGDDDGKEGEDNAAADPDEEEDKEEDDRLDTSDYGLSLKCSMSPRTLCATRTTA